ncbi:MAG TPA: dihydrolipoyl dehydrogenase [Nitrososphaerales archaeon]|nr:dihydrolipoyl dehydrogenase [Nitrososphaerales archaeon]
MQSADVVVIGGGPGGYVCAIRAAQLGLKTILIEKDRLGGNCLIVGCIPSKALISVTKLYEKAKEGATFGIIADGIRVDLPALQKWKAGVVSTLETGVANLCRGNKVVVIRGEAELISADRLEVKTSEGVEEVHAKNVVIATGSTAISLPGLEFDGKLIISSTEALALDKLPESMLVIGGGYIGLEVATVYQKLGSKVTIVELTDQLLPGTEPDLVRLPQRNLEKRGARILLKSKVLSLEKGDGGVKARVSTPSGEVVVEASLALVSVGRMPLTAGMNLSKIGVETDAKGYVVTDAQMRTNVEGVYAVGDVRGQPLLAHKAMKEGAVAADVIAGLPSAADWKSIPWAIFTDPEIAGVGLTEKAAVEAGLEVKRSRFSFAALGRALAAGEAEGFARIVSNAKSGLVLGVQIVGPDASNLISEAALAIEMGATVEDLALTIHPHPTLPEALMEAAEVAAGRPIHQMKGL